MNFKNSFLTVIKENETTREKLAGAVFELKSKIKTVRQTTNEAGTTAFEVKPCGRYVLKETTPPEGYELNDTEYQISIDSCGNIKVDGEFSDAVTVGNTPSQFQVHYLNNGGTGEFIDSDLKFGTIYTIKSDTDTGIFNPIYYPTHYFGSWNTKADGTGTRYLPGDTINLTKNLTLYAIWFILHDVSYVNNAIPGITTGGSQRSDLPYTILTPEQLFFTKPGYSFVNWDTEKDGGGIVYHPGDTLTLTGNIRMYAQWTAIQPEI